MSSKVMIRPYVNTKVTNHGLEKHNMVIADNCEHGQWLRCLDSNGVKTYITGLNEGAKEVQQLDEEKRNAKILDIRKTVVMLENQIAGNYNISEADIYVTEKITTKKKKKGSAQDSAETEDVEETVQKFNPLFWTKVTKFKSVIPDEFDDNQVRKPTFWDTVELKCSNVPLELNPLDPRGVMIIKAIEAGGFGDLVAPSLEKALDGGRVYKFYMDKLDETADLQVQDDRMRNKAGAKLELLMDKPDKLFLVVKNLIKYSLTYKKRTSPSIIYHDINRYLDAKGDEHRQKIAIEKFNDLCDDKKYSITQLKIMAYVKDAMAANTITTKGDGILYYMRKGIPMGKSYEDVVAYLSNPGNSDVLEDISNVVEKEWNS